jgi:hypothetical protein
VSHLGFIHAMNNEFDEQSSLSSREAPADLLIPVGEFVGLLMSALLTIGILLFGFSAFTTAAEEIVAVAAKTFVGAAAVSASPLSSTKTLDPLVEPTTLSTFRAARRTSRRALGFFSPARAPHYRLSTFLAAH